jgi:hypothetical protein
MSWKNILKKTTQVKSTEPFNVDILNQFRTALEIFYSDIGVIDDGKVRAILYSTERKQDNILLDSVLRYRHKLAKNSADKDMFGKVRADDDPRGKAYRKLENALHGLIEELNLDEDVWEEVE